MVRGIFLRNEGRYKKKIAGLHRENYTDLEKGTRKERYGVNEGHSIPRHMNKSTHAQLSEDSREYTRHWVEAVLPEEGVFWYQST